MSPLPPTLQSLASVAITLQSEIPVGDNPPDPSWPSNVGAEQVEGGGVGVGAGEAMRPSESRVERNRITFPWASRVLSSVR